MISISICICTRRRQQGLQRLLESIENVVVPPDSDIQIIVVENDGQNYSEQTVTEISSRSKFNVRYFLETRQGLSFARNRSVFESNGCDFCCFVDDDQIVDTDWLIELVKCQKEFNADGVWGINPPIFDKEVPAYVQTFYQPDKFNYGTIVTKAFTNCLLLRKKYLDKINGPFDTRLNYTGGEDSFLTCQFSKSGGVIRHNPNAIASEIIPEDRTSLKYIIKRTYRIANAELFVNTLKDNGFSKWSAMPRLILRFCYGLLIAIPFFIFGKDEKLKGLIKITNATGGLFFLIGKHNQFYK